MVEKLDTARTQAEFDRTKACTRVGGPSVLSLFNDNHFKFVTGFVFESMPKDCEFKQCFGVYT